MISSKKTKRSNLKVLTHEQIKSLPVETKLKLYEKAEKSIKSNDNRVITVEKDFLITAYLIIGHEIFNGVIST